VEILVTLGSLLAVLIFAGWSCARSYFDYGRRRGVEDATREILRGLNSHYESSGQNVPESVKKALAALKAASGKRCREAHGSTDHDRALLWRLGDAIGEACWLKGHAAGLRRKAPAEGKIRIDLSLTELLQLSCFRISASNT
jgi:hypothetical protein